MNEQDNTALIRKIYDAFARGDIQTIIENTTGDVVWTLEGPDTIPYAGTRKGANGVKEFFDALVGTQRDMKLTMEDFIAQGDKVATLGHYAATVKATGKKFDSPHAHFFTIRDGKVSRWVGLGDMTDVTDAYQSASAARL